MGVLRGKSGSVVSRRRIAPAPAALTLSAFVLAACSTAFGPGPQQAALPVPAKPEMSPTLQREHQRILAAYGGAYESPRLDPMLTRTVDKLVAASERPDLKYEITVLNS